MKTKFLILIAVIAFISLSAFGNVYAAKNSLETLSKTFNSCSTVTKYKDSNYVMESKVSGNKLIVNSKFNEESKTYEFTLKDSILSIKTKDMSALFIATILTDCAGQLNGYKDGELFDTLNSDEIADYTLAKEGFEIKTVSEGEYEISIDIDKKLPLVDLSNVYIKPADLDILKNIVDSGEPGGTTGNKTKMSYNVSISDTVVIYIGERDKITESTYNSILSVIEVIFGENEKNNFASKYPAMKDENTTFDKYTIEVDLLDSEVSLPEGSKITKVTIKDTSVKDNESDIVTIEKSEATNVNIENKDNNNILLYIALSAVACIVIIAVIVVLMKKKN